ncbi:MAG: TatD family hydrolase, partial [Candidatus Hadarchaeum sp.]
MKLIDCHAHLEEVPNLDQELKSAKEKGVAAIIAVGSDLYSNISVQQISEHYPNYVYPALGLHPWNLDRIDETIQIIEKNIERCVALGEVGLDFKYQTPKELQVKAFARILELAERYDKPVIIHSRWAWREAFEMVKKAEIRRAVFHWYSGPLDVLQEILVN